MSISVALQKKILMGTSIWSALGYYRGIKQYRFEHDKKMTTYQERMTRYNKDQIMYPHLYQEQPDKPIFYYCTSFLFGLAGSGIYLFPGTIVVCFCKEIYRLEINLRGLEDQKKQDHYNEII